MEIIYAWFDADGFCSGWSSSPEEGTIPVAVTIKDSETDIRNNFRNWHYNVETEELFYNETKVLEEKKEELKNQLKHDAMLKAIQMLMQVDEEKMAAIDGLETLSDAVNFNNRVESGYSLG